MTSQHIFLYGPPGSGKSTLAEALAKELELPFVDLDNQVEASAGITISEIFARFGEDEFRRLEALHLAESIKQFQAAVIALGGGALLSEESRHLAELAGVVVCLQAPQETLLERLSTAPTSRPLLSGNQLDRLQAIMAERNAHYESFPVQINSADKPLHDILNEIHIRLGRFRVHGMGNHYDIRVQTGIIQNLTSFLPPDLSGRKMVVTDEHVGAHYGSLLASQLTTENRPAETITVPAGENSKSLDQLQQIWERLLQLGADRQSILVALGGGVVGDLGGFAAATFLRGIPWINVPSTLLAQVDAGIGGKTGINLPQGKNLAGAFYPPALVFIDPELLTTLPPREKYNGMAEVIKHGVIADPVLFDQCQGGKGYLESSPTELVSRAAAVKINFVQIDPFETSQRQALNYGHTIGHAVEKALNFNLLHGEAVAIGMVAEAYIAEQLGIAPIGLHNKIADVLQKFELPTQIPADLSTTAIIKTARYDKKRRLNTHRLALPRKIGEVQVGVEIEDLTPLLADFRRSFSP